MIEHLPFTTDNIQLAAIGINRQMLPVFLGLLGVTAVAWLFVANRLYSELRKNNPGLYQALGSPKLIMKKSFRANFRLIRFLLQRGYETVDDPAVVRLCQGLRTLFCLYLICLAGCVIILVAKTA